VKALCWEGGNEVAVEEVPDPQIINKQDAIVKVKLSPVCGSDLHQIRSYIPAMRSGDVIGHEFLGEIVEVGPEVSRRSVGDPVVVCSVFACGRGWYCEQGLFSCCDNGNTNPAITEAMWGHHPAGIFGYSHAMGGFKGSHAEYIRVPYADYITFPVPEGLDEGLRGYDRFKNKKDCCVRAVFQP
jgi:threonine dehydrogenase-like Zn-dependent dehydrogenase